MDNIIDNIIKDCESIIKEIKENEVTIRFVTSESNDFTKKKQLLIYDKSGRIIVMKDYSGGPEDFQIKYKNSKFSKPKNI